MGTYQEWESTLVEEPSTFKHITLNYALEISKIQRNQTI